MVWIVSGFELLGVIIAQRMLSKMDLAWSLHVQIMTAKFDGDVDSDVCQKFGIDENQTESVGDVDTDVCQQFVSI